MSFAPPSTVNRDPWVGWFSAQPSLSISRVIDDLWRYQEKEKNVVCLCFPQRNLISVSRHRRTVPTTISTSTWIRPGAPRSASGCGPEARRLSRVFLRGSICFYSSSVYLSGSLFCRGLSPLPVPHSSPTLLRCLRLGGQIHIPQASPTASPAAAAAKSVKVPKRAKSKVRTLQRQSLLSPAGSDAAPCTDECFFCTPVL